MPRLNQLRRIGAAAVLISVPFLHANAQTAPPAGTDSPAPPPAAKPAPMPVPTPAPAPDRQVTAPTTPGKVDPLVGLSVLSSDGSKLGTVHSVKTMPDGKVEAIQLKTGGFLGFGAKLVAIPEGKFARKGDTIQAQMTADEVSKLPEVKEQS